MRHSFTLSALLLGLLTQIAVAATQVSYEVTRLTPVMQGILDANGKASEYLQTRIESERKRIRENAAADVQALLAQETKKLQEANVTPIDRQNALIQKLNDVISEMASDIDLLNAEEKRFYQGTTSSDDATAVKQTSSHAELLARKMMLEEYIGVFEESTNQEEVRLSSLLRVERLNQFGSLIELGTYILIIVVTVMLERIIRKRMIPRIKHARTRYFLLKLFSALIYILGMLFLVSLLVTNHPGFLASLAIIGAGIAIALQDLIKDFVGWILILQRRYYKLGQRVTIGAITGDVVDIAPLRTTLLEVGDTGPMHSKRTGKTVTIPNSLMLREAVINYHSTSDFVASDMSVVVTYESDWRKAHELLLEIVKKHTSQFSVQAQAQQRRRTSSHYTMWDISDPQVHVDLVASGIQFSLRFYVPIGGSRTIVTDMTRDILTMIDAEPSIALAYDTMRIVQERS